MFLHARVCRRICFLLWQLIDNIDFFMIVLISIYHIKITLAMLTFKSANTVKKCPTLWLWRKFSYWNPADWGSFNIPSTRRSRLGRRSERACPTHLFWEVGRVTHSQGADREVQFLLWRPEKLFAVLEGRAQNEGTSWQYPSCKWRTTREDSPLHAPSGSTSQMVMKMIRLSVSVMGPSKWPSPR